MKTYHKLTPAQKSLRSNKNELLCNFQFLTNVIDFAMNHIDNHDVISQVNSKISSTIDFIDDLFTIHSHETLD